MRLPLLLSMRTSADLIHAGSDDREAEPVIKAFCDGVKFEYVLN